MLYVKFCFKLDHSATKRYNMFEHTSGGKTVSRTVVIEQFLKFGGGVTSV
jgi:hypothetical protein